MERDERLDDIAASIRRVEEQQKRERVDARERGDRIEGRLSQVEHRQGALERSFAGHGNNFAELLQRVVRVEDENLTTKRALDEQGRVSAANMERAIAHVRSVESSIVGVKTDVGKRLDKQDAELSDQSTKLDRLVAADTERALFERWQREQSVARTSTLNRILWWVKFALAIGALVGGVATAVVWILPHLR